ncbi:hypothetical protein ABFS83_10G053100 [Erythranthe nasuta]
MEDSSAQRQNLALNPSNANYTFPPHRRRPLRSRTYRALIGIMSHSRVDSPHLQKLVDSDDSVLRPAFQENGSPVRNEVDSVDVLAPYPNCKVPEDTLVQETTVSENREKNCFQDGVIDGKNITEAKVDRVNVIKDAEHEGSRNLSVVENQMDDFDIHVSKDQENASGVLDIQMEGLEVDKDFCIGDFSEALDSCFDMDTVVELSKSGENGMVLEENIPKETEFELKVKEMELEKLVHNSAVVEPSCCLNANDDDMEEGEISGEDEFVDAPFDALSEFAVHASDGSSDKEKDTCHDEDRGREKTDPSLVNVVNSDTDFMEVESRTTFGKMQENAAEDQICATTEKDQDQDLGKKKRKKGPLTKERRAKKKKKERIKRAEKNREDGVRRANPQPIIKAKKISECRHYKYGRCYEGEKCKFSHDAVPLTKSTPCAYFARNSCMKGKDCPFDHELSKYPCTKYTTDNSCPRGSNCSFSHEKPAKQSFSITPNTSVPELTSPQHTVPDKRRSSAESKATKPELKFSTPPNNTNTIKQTDNYGILHQRSNGKSIDPLPMNPVTRTVRQPPRGVSFLSTGEKSSGESSKHKVDEPSVKTTNGVDAGCKTSLDKSSEMSEKVAPMKPRGINFLSFAQPSSDNSSSNIFSNLPLTNSKSGTSVINGTNDGKLTSSLLENDGALTANRQMNQSAANKLQDTIQIPSLSFGGTMGQSTGRQNPHFSSSFKTSLLSNTPSSVQNAIQSTLAFAEKFEPDIKVGSYLHQLRS